MMPIFAFLLMIPGALGGPLLSGSAAAQVPGYSTYTDWRDWARLKRGAIAGLASSYDRAGGNDDFSQYESPAGPITTETACTVATLTGPGVIWRFWMPHLTAKIPFAVRLYCDGDATPRIDTASDVLLAGGYGYFQAPLVDTFAGGQTCYEPIAFAQSLRIETVNRALPPGDVWSPYRHYYQYAYTLYPAPTPVTSYSGVLTPEQQAGRAAVTALFGGVGQHPAGSSPTAIRLSVAAQTIAGGDSLIVADLAGPGVVRQLSVRMEAATDAELAALRLRVHYDGEPAPAIDVPVGDFFGAGRQRAPYRSLPLGTDGPDGFYCYWPLPFHRAVRVGLHNSGAQPVTIDGAVVECEPGPVDNDLCYLHAVVQTDLRADGEVYHTLLTATGRGHYVGNLLYVEEDHYYFGMLEGDDVMLVDGARGLYGTGLEDAYNGGYYYNWVGVQSDEPEGAAPRSAIRPLSGILYVDRHWGPAYARADQYRWRVADCVPFTRSLEVLVENRYAQAGSRWTSVAFWYQQPPLPGDLNCDGTVDFDDINPFVTALVSQTGYEAEHPDCRWLSGDIDDNGQVDFDDIDPFVALLAH
jgi:hypothetical protein